MYTSFYCHCSPIRPSYRVEIASQLVCLILASSPNLSSHCSPSWCCVKAHPIVFVPCPPGENPPVDFLWLYDVVSVWSARDNAIFTEALVTFFLSLYSVRLSSHGALSRKGLLSFIHLVNTLSPCRYKSNFLFFRE